MKHEKVYALYANFEDAASAIRHLTQDEYDGERLTVIVNDADERLKRYTEADFHDDAVEADEGGGWGAVVGTLTALSIAVLPGVGPVFAAGPLGVALIAGIGAATGAATGAAVAEVVEFEIDKADAETYAKTLKDGGALIVVDAYGDWEEDHIKSILQHYNAKFVEDTD